MSKPTHQRKSSSGVFAWQPIDEHVGLWGYNGWVDEAQEEKSTDQGANREVGGVWVLALKDKKILQCMSVHV